ncbi:hypothetical protein [Leucobacter sp. GX24907]
MRIRESNAIVHATSVERQKQILESITELEQQYEDGEIETPAYWIKKRALVRML